MLCCCVALALPPTEAARDTRYKLRLARRGLSPSFWVSSSLRAERTQPQRTCIGLELGREQIIISGYGQVAEDSEYSTASPSPKVLTVGTTRWEPRNRSERM